MRASKAFLPKSAAIALLLLAVLSLQPAMAGDATSPLQQAVDALLAQVAGGGTHEVAGSRTSRQVALDGRHVFVTTLDVSAPHGGNRGGTLLVVHESGDVGERSQGSHQARSVRLVAFAWIAGRGWRTLDASALRVDGPQLVFPGLARRPDDPSCCPSQPVEARYSLANDNLVAH